MFSKDAVAKLVGFGGAVGTIGGIAFPLLTGPLLDRYANGYAIIFACCAFAYLVASAIHHALAPAIEPVPPRSQTT